MQDQPVLSEIEVLTQALEDQRRRIDDLARNQIFLIDIVEEMLYNYPKSDRKASFVSALLHEKNSQLVFALQDCIFDVLTKLDPALARKFEFFWRQENDEAARHFERQMNRFRYFCLPKEK